MDTCIPRGQTDVGGVDLCQLVFLFGLPQSLQKSRALGISSCVENLILAKNLGNAWMVPTPLPLYFHPRGQLRLWGHLPPIPRSPHKQRLRWKAP